MASKRWIIPVRHGYRRESVREGWSDEDSSGGRGLGPGGTGLPAQETGSGKPGDGERGQDNAAPADRIAIYHCVSRVVDRRLIFGAPEKDRFVELMRKYEAFAGVRILAHCVMSNHFHILVEIPPMPEGGLTDDQLLDRLAAIYDEATVDATARELRDARRAVDEGRAGPRRVEEIHRRHAYRMHDLSEFMKSLVQRFTQWFNRRHERKGNLWEDAFRSVVVEPGTAARMVSAYIDLNPLRAGMVKDPADYRWSSYGCACAAGPRNRNADIACHLARTGLIRAWFAPEEAPRDAAMWRNWHQEYRALMEAAIKRHGAESTDQKSDTPDPPGAALAGRIRHFSDGVVLGSRDFVDGFFLANRPRFGARRASGARRIRGKAAAMTQRDGLWTLRDLQTNLGP